MAGSGVARKTWKLYKIFNTRTNELMCSGTSAECAKALGKKSRKYIYAVQAGSIKGRYAQVSRMPYDNSKYKRHRNVRVNMYAIYKGDTYIDSGTAYELSEKMGVARNVIYSIYSRRKEYMKYPNRMYAVKLEDDNSDIE